MIWLLAATSEVPLGGNERVIFNHPSSDKNTVIQYVRAQGLGTRQVRYQLFPIPPNDSNELVICVQRAVPILSQEGVAAAQSSPHGQTGQARPTGERDSVNFQELGDEALPVATGDNMFAEVPDGMGTYTDLVRDGATIQEIQREQ